MRLRRTDKQDENNEAHLAFRFFIIHSGEAIDVARVLVVDDDKQIVRVLQTYLTQEGMTVLTAYDGKERWD